MAASTAKKVIVHRFDREAIIGYVSHHTYLASDGVEVLSPEGNVNAIPYRDIRCVCFVKDFEGAWLPERREFLTRPKQEGLWMRLRFVDGTSQEGVAANNLLSLESPGFAMIPPDATGNVQRLFVPRTALLEAKVLGVVGSPVRRPVKRAKPEVPDSQIKMFE